MGVKKNTPPAGEGNKLPIPVQHCYQPNILGMIIPILRSKFGFLPDSGHDQKAGTINDDGAKSMYSRIGRALQSLLREEMLVPQRVQNWGG
jgi:hypothetical protein